MPSTDDWLPAVCITANHSAARFYTNHLCDECIISAGKVEYCEIVLPEGTAGNFSDLKAGVCVEVVMETCWSGGVRYARYYATHVRITSHSIIDLARYEGLRQTSAKVYHLTSDVAKFYISPMDTTTALATRGDIIPNRSVNPRHYLKLHQTYLIVCAKDKRRDVPHTRRKNNSRYRVVQILNLQKSSSPDTSTSTQGTSSPDTSTSAQGTSSPDTSTSAQGTSTSAQGTSTSAQGTSSPDTSTSAQGTSSPDTSTSAQGTSSPDTSTSTSAQGTSSPDTSTSTVDCHTADVSPVYSVAAPLVHDVEFVEKADAEYKSAEHGDINVCTEAIGTASSGCTAAITNSDTPLSACGDTLTSYVSGSETTEPYPGLHKLYEFEAMVHAHNIALKRIIDPNPLSWILPVSRPHNMKEITPSVSSEPPKSINIGTPEPSVINLSQSDVAAQTTASSTNTYGGSPEVLAHVRETDAGETVLMIDQEVQTESSKWKRAFVDN